MAPNYLTIEQIDWIFASQENVDVAQQMLSWLEYDPTYEAIGATQMTLTALAIGQLTGPYNTTYFNAIDPYTNADLTIMDPIWTVYFSAKCAVLKAENPDWSDARVFWEASKEMIHLALDIGGLVPVIGEICDVANGIIYTVEGDGVNATLSFAGAIPIAGWFATGAKFAYKGSLKFVVKASGVIDFGSRSKLRKVLGITNPNLHAHHLISWEQIEHELVQKAAKSSNAFHMNEVLNGIPRPTNLHLTGHQAYNTKINNVLNYINTSNPNLSYDEAYIEITSFASYLKNLINTNPTLNSGQIADLINYP